MKTTRMSTWRGIKLKIMFENPISIILDYFHIFGLFQGHSQLQIEI